MSDNDLITLHFERLASMAEVYAARYAHRAGFFTFEELRAEALAALPRAEANYRSKYGEMGTVDEWVGYACLAMHNAVRLLFRRTLGRNGTKVQPDANGEAFLDAERGHAWYSVDADDPTASSRMDSTTAESASTLAVRRVIQIRREHRSDAPMIDIRLTIDRKLTARLTLRTDDGREETRRGRRAWSLLFALYRESGGQGFKDLTMGTLEDIRQAYLKELIGLGLSTAEIATRMGVSRRSVTNWKNLLHGAKEPEAPTIEPEEVL